MMIESLEDRLQRKWEELTIANDFLFCKVMQNPELCRLMLERILEFRIDEIRFPEAQRTMEAGYDAHGIRLDLYTDDGRTIYNVEMQTTDTGDLPRRSRYYGSMIDVQELNRGVYYKELKDRIVIFICLFDIFGEGRHRYTFRKHCEEQPELVFEDGTTEIFLNCRGRRGEISTGLQNFLNYIGGAAASDSLTQRIDEEVWKAKQNGKWRREYMKLEMRDRDNLERGREEGRKEGLEEGREEGIIEGRREAQERFAALVGLLLRDDRNEDLKRCSEDAEYCEALFREYGL